MCVWGGLLHILMMIFLCVLCVMVGGMFYFLVLIPILAVYRSGEGRRWRSTVHAWCVLAGFCNISESMHVWS